MFGNTWTNDEICAFYDSNPDVTLSQLAMITGKTVAELKAILRG